MSFTASLIHIQIYGLLYEYIICQCHAAPSMPTDHGPRTVVRRVPSFRVSNLEPGCNSDFCKSKTLITAFILVSSASDNILYRVYGVLLFDNRYPRTDPLRRRRVRVSVGCTYITASNGYKVPITYGNEFRRLFKFGQRHGVRSKGSRNPYIIDANPSSNTAWPQFTSNQHQTVQ